MKVRIFSLAKELDVDSKVLIQHCLDAGLDVKISPLASITEDERDLLMAHLKKVGVTGLSTPGAPASSSSISASVPGSDLGSLTREQAEIERTSKLREIKTLGPLGGSLRSRRGPRVDGVETPSRQSALRSLLTT